MPFGNKSRNVRAYEFGCLPPLYGENEAIEIMKKRVQLWNQLVELSHKFNDKKEQMIAAYINVSNDDENRDEYKKQRKEAFKREDVKNTLKIDQKSEYEESKILYQNSGLYWGNYLDVTNGWNVSRKKPGDLKFHSSRDGGKVSVQWPTGVSISDVFDHTSNVLRLNPVNEDAYTNPIRSIRRKSQRSVISIRIASDENKKPIWLTLPCVLHRPLPENGIIRSACVLRERIATHWRWKLVIVVETPEIVKPVENIGTIALDTGWRKVLEGLRVGYWSDSNEKFGQILLDNHFIEGMKKCNDIQSIRDNNFNQAVKSLILWIEKTDLPDWFKEYTQYISKWKSQAKLAWLVIKWRDSRIAGDNEIYLALEEWRKRDKHLYEYEFNLKDRLITQRREIYRKFAAWVAQNYSHVIIKDTDLRPLSTKAKKGGLADELYEDARYQRVLAATSILISAIKNVCKRDQIVLEEKEATNTTRKCCICGYIDTESKTDKVDHICPNCTQQLGLKIKLDRDYNSTQNLLLSGSKL